VSEGCGDLLSSGSARFERRGGRNEPMRGSKNRDEKRAKAGEIRKVFKLARSERYIWPAKMPIRAVASEPGKRLIAS
jgi:hypothetical protein